MWLGPWASQAHIRYSIPNYHAQFWAKKIALSSFNSRFAYAPVSWNSLNSHPQPTDEHSAQRFVQTTTGILILNLDFVIFLAFCHGYPKPPDWLIKYFKAKLRLPAPCLSHFALIIGGMKILKEDAGVLTNFEVLDFLRGRGAAKDPTRVLAPLAPSEFKVYDYLEQNVGGQTRESIAEFVEKCKPYKLTKCEMMSIINIRPSSLAQIDPLEDLNSRLGEDATEELVDLIVQVFPPPPNEDEEIENDLIA